MSEYDFNDYSHMPPHKRPGYAERMYEAADMRRKAKREDALTGDTQEDSSYTDECMRRGEMGDYTKPRGF